MLATSRLVGHEPVGGDVGGGVVEVVPGAQGHDDFFERAVARPFAEAVDRAFDLPGPGLDGRQAVGHGQAEIVVAVDADHGLVDVRHAIAESADDVAHVGRRGVADRVGNVDRGGAGVDGRLDHLAEEIGFGARGVLGRELDVRAVALGPFHAGDGVADDLVLVHLQLVLAMDRAGGQKDVDPRPLGRGCTASQARSMSASRQRASPQITEPRTDRAISRTASKSPGEAMGKPASITSTPKSTSAWATSIFSARFMLAPGDCSPSRSVVSKITICRDSSFFISHEFDILYSRVKFRLC